MYITAFFTKDYSPATGLIPTVSALRLSDNTLVVDGQQMSESNLSGFYYWNWTEYGEDQEYVITADGGTDLDEVERYKFGGSAEADIKLIKGDVEFLKNIEGGKWEIVENQMIFYKADNLTEVARFNLFDASGNPAMEKVYKRERL